MRRLGIILLLVFGLVLVSACSKKVITVAGMVTEDGEETKYIEMQEFEIKEQISESNKEKINFCAVMIPSTYQESEQIPGMYVHKRAPLDSSNIYYTVTKEGENGEVSDQLTKESYKKSVEEAYQNAGQEIELNVKSFERIDMDGVPGYKVRSSYQSGKNEIEQLTYIIAAKDTCTLTYSQLSGDELMADFEISDGEIRLVKENDISVASRK